MCDAEAGRAQEAGGRFTPGREEVGTGPSGPAGEFELYSEWRLERFQSPEVTMLGCFGAVDSQ